jgi:hypothetical protein
MSTEQSPATETDTLPVPTAFTRFLWFCAGADGSLLKRCPQSDWIKYQGIGGIVFATAMLAFVSASYAFYTVFSPKTDTALQATAHFETAAASTVAGVLWALVIFNIDRFIVSSTGKGDGTEKITLQEFMQSMPRLLMAGIIGVCISAPLEIRILKPEIDAQLELEQNEYLRKLNEHSEGLTQARKEELITKADKAQHYLTERAEYFEKRRLEIKEQRHLLEIEAEGKSSKGVAGRGPAWRDKKETLDKMEEELTGDRKTYQEKADVIAADISNYNKQLGQLAQELEAAKSSNLSQSRHLDGLMKRIHISHSIGGLVPWAILLLLLAVETGPIFFKMMLVHSTYDYLSENAKRLAVARAGIEMDAQVLYSERNEAIRIDHFHGVDSRLAEEKRRIESENQVAAAIHERFREATQQEVRTGDGYKKYVDEG